MRTVIRTVTPFVVAILLALATPILAGDPELTGERYTTRQILNGSYRGVVVELPVAVSGARLAAILVEETKNTDPLEIRDLSEYRYVPGSVKKEVQEYAFRIYKPRSLFQPSIELRTSFYPQKNYTHLVFESFDFYSTNDRRYEKIRGDLENLIGRLYSRLGHSNR